MAPMRRRKVARNSPKKRQSRDLCCKAAASGSLPSASITTRNEFMSVVAKLGFGQKDIEDLEAVFDSLPPYEAGKTKVSSSAP